MSKPVTLPGSPGKSGLFRTNATSLRNQCGPLTIPSEPHSATGMPFAGEREGRESQSPDKENRQCSPGELQSEKRGRYGNPLQRSSSPERPSKPRARSMSPSKAFRIRKRDHREALSPLDGATAPETLRNPREVDHDFVSMLGTMQIPSAMVHKLMTLDTRVKDNMLKGQASLTLSALSAAATNTHKSKVSLSERFTRSKSNANLASSSSCSSSSTSDDVNLPFAKVPASRTPSGGSSDSSGGSSSSLQRGREAMYLSRANPSSVSVANSTASTVRSRSGSFGGKENGGASPLSATGYATMLKATDASRLDVSRIKKMRAVLASESPAWLAEFFDESGYQAILFRLQELLEVEWRDEQHDDQLLHELLRCFVALSSTDCGRLALSSATPTPFVELSNLLFSEKRPGDLGTRKLLVEILCMLPELPAPSLQAASRIDQVRSTRVSSTVLDSVVAQGSRSMLLMLLLTILHNPRDPTQEALVDFISVSHTQRPFKVLVTELLNINRDYFWIFCHSSNRFWTLGDVDVNEAQGPKVPGGMTGGVEFEAMGYLTSHWRMINLVVRRVTQFGAASGQERLAHDLHSLLFASGLDRALSITRKASQNYYQALHLEMARYFDLVRRAGFQVPAHLEAWQSSPQLLPATTGTAQRDVTSLVGSCAPTFPAKTDNVTSYQQGPPPVLALPFSPSDLSVPLHNPHPITKPKSTTFKPPARSNEVSGDASQGTLVGTAVKRWEQRAADSGIMATFGAVQGSRSPPAMPGGGVAKPMMAQTEQRAWQAPKDWA